MLLNDQHNVEMPDLFAFTPVGSGSGLGSMSLGPSSPAGISTATGIGYANPIGKDRIVSGRLTIGEDWQWSSFAKTFDVVGEKDGTPFFDLFCCVFPERFRSSTDCDK